MVRLLVLAMVLAASGCGIAWYEADASNDPDEATCPLPAITGAATARYCTGDEAQKYHCASGCYVFQPGPEQGTSAPCCP